MPLNSITRLRVRSWRYLPAFFLLAIRSARQAARAEGSIAVKILAERRMTFWTSTAWTNEAAMRKFMSSGVHGRGMRKLLTWCDEAAVVHWTEETVGLPDWQASFNRLRAEGRRSKVLHPSPGQTAYEFPPPPARTPGELTFKTARRA